jgi:hypothetical protein
MLLPDLRLGVWLSLRRRCIGGDDERGDTDDFLGGEVERGYVPRVGVEDGVDDEGGEEVTTQETGWPRAWLRQSRIGRRTG